GDLARFGVDAKAFCEAHTPPDGVMGSATRLHRDGVSVRLLADYWSPLAAALDDLRHHVRTEYMQLPATDLRK
ncbi:MAG: hypothetical protein AAFR56_13890, partial [Chloroflexota bacterium]